MVKQEPKSTEEAFSLPPAEWWHIKPNTKYYSRESISEFYVWNENSTTSIQKIAWGDTPWCLGYIKAILIREVPFFTA